jgi:hypothetical protein
MHPCVAYSARESRGKIERDEHDSHSNFFSPGTWQLLPKRNVLYSTVFVIPVRRLGGGINSARTRWEKQDLVHVVRAVPSFMMSEACSCSCSGQARQQARRRATVKLYSYSYSCSPAHHALPRSSDLGAEMACPWDMSHFHLFLIFFSLYSNCVLGQMPVSARFVVLPVSLTCSQSAVLVGNKGPRALAFL